MNYLIDTNVLSEPQRMVASLKVIHWLREHEAEIYTSTVVIAEVAYGIACLPAGPKRLRLEGWLQELLQRLRGRVLGVNTRVALEWAALAAEARSRRGALPFRDSLIAATARRYKLTLATNNTRDFAGLGVKTVNPFE